MTSLKSTYLPSSSGNIFRTSLTAQAGITFFKYEIESIIDKFVPLKKQGKRSRKKHLSKEAIRKIVFNQTMWRVYRCTRKDEDYAN